jgi:hypothetical protein
MNNKDLDLSQITLIDHTALGEENWQDYSITVDPNDIVINEHLDYDFSNINISMNNDSYINGKMYLEGEGADIEINGKSLSSAIANIEERLAILHCNPELEAEFQELHQLGEQYRKVEKQLMEKKTVWDKLNRAEGD